MQPITPINLSGCCSFVCLNFSQRAVNLFLGVLTYTACIVENAVGFLGRIDHGVAMAFQVGDDHLTVQNIHLAANGLDVNAFVHLFHVHKQLIHGLACPAFRAGQVSSAVESRLGQSDVSSSEGGESPTVGAIRVVLVNELTQTVSDRFVRRRFIKLNIRICSD